MRLLGRKMREGKSRLEDLIPKAEDETISPKKTFEDDEPGFVRIDITYLPQMPDETSRRDHVQFPVQESTLSGGGTASWHGCKNF